MYQHGEAGYGVGRLASRNRNTTFAAVWKHRSLYALAALPVLWFLVFRYLPLFNAQIAFKQYFPMEGVLKSPWIGFGNILYFINSPNFGKIMFNTLFYSFAKLIIGLPLAVMLALAIYESAFPLFRKAVQTMSYLPHFLSWIIVYGILTILLSQGGGLVNQIIKALGGTEMDFLGNSRTFPWVVILSDAWKEMGWSAIIFLAALMAIDPCLYEAADIEGANRVQRLRFVTLPGIADVIVVVLLLRLGTILNAGFYQLIALRNDSIASVAEIVDTWVYFNALQDIEMFGAGAAVGLFKGLFGMLLLVVSNRLAKRISGSGLY